jgi:hypothetical protein
VNTQFSPDRPPSDPELAELTFVDPGGQLDFLRKHYLESYLPAGGSKLKLIIGREGSGKTCFAQRLLTIARRAGYLTLLASARDIQFSSFDHIYRQVMQAAPIWDQVRTYADRVLRDLGYGFSVREHERTFVEWAIAEGRDSSSVKREIREQVGRDLYRDRNLDRSFAVAVTRMTAAELGAQPLEPEMRHVLERWLTGLPVSARERNRLELRKPVDRHTARLLLRSYLHWVPRVGARGLVFVIDDTDEVTGNRRDSAVRYTKGRRDEFYESLRQVIDEIDALPGLMILLVGRRELWEDERRGIPSYDALLLRLQNEVRAEEVNRFGDLIDMDHLWRQDEGGVSKIALKLLEAAEGDQALRARVLGEIGRLEHGGTVSPVRRSVAATLYAIGGSQ